MEFQLSPTCGSAGKKGLGIGSSSPHYSEKKRVRGSAEEFFFFWWEFLLMRYLDHWIVS